MILNLMLAMLLFASDEDHDDCSYKLFSKLIHKRSANQKLLIVFVDLNYLALY